MECVWCVYVLGGWGLKADTENEMEHVAYREISTECSLMNTPLYLCYNGKGRLYDVPTPTHTQTHTYSFALVHEFSLETRDVIGSGAQRLHHHINSQHFETLSFCSVRYDRLK